MVNAIAIQIECRTCGPTRFLLAEPAPKPRVKCPGCKQPLYWMAIPGSVRTTHKLPHTEMLGKVVRPFNPEMQPEDK